MAPRAVVVMARAPSSPGKTRLVGGRPPDVARALREALLLDTIDAVQAASIPVVVACTPAGAMHEIHTLVGTRCSRLVAQADGDIGARMHAAFEDAFESGTDQVIVVGSDLPSLPASHVTEGFERLGRGCDIVLGPAADGGYYLIGTTASIRSRISQLFGGVEWGARNVLSQTRAAADRACLAVSMLPSWYDIDRPEDLTRLARESAPDVAPRTRDWIRCHHD